MEGSSSFLAPTSFLCMRCSCHGILNHKPDTNLITCQQLTLPLGIVFSVFVLLVSFEWKRLKYRRHTRKTGDAERCPESLRLFARCIPRSPCCSSRRPSLWPPCLQRLDLERQKRTNAFFFEMIDWIFWPHCFPWRSLGRYLCWGVCGPPRCSLCSWPSCPRCRVHSATCKLSLSRLSSGQTGHCMTSSVSWQPTSHTSTASIRFVASRLHNLSNWIPASSVLLLHTCSTSYQNRWCIQAHWVKFCSYTPFATVCVEILQLVQFWTLRCISQTGRGVPGNLQISQQTRVQNHQVIRRIHCRATFCCFYRCVLTPSTSVALQ